jgi:heme a synthase
MGKAKRLGRDEPGAPSGNVVALCEMMGDRGAMRWNLFQRAMLVTLIVTLFLIFVGGFVRAAGAGLGCPDWPRCFGHWWPPSGPEGLVGTEFEGQEDLFNARKMWIEYINRLVGMLVGLLILGTALISVGHWGRDKLLTLGSFGAAVLVAFQGWLGGEVVTSELEGRMVTVHMVVAVVLFSLLLWLLVRSFGLRARLGEGVGGRRWLWWLGWLMFAVTCVQVVLGSQVREILDAIASSVGAPGREDWLELVGWKFAIHRSFSWLPLVIGFGVLVVAWRGGGLGRGGWWLVGGMVGVLGVQLLSGLGLAFWGLPPALQVVHLGLSTMLASLAFLLGLVARGSVRTKVSEGVDCSVQRSGSGTGC